MKTEYIEQAYQVAKKRYAEFGIDTEKIIDKLQQFHLSLHCWQADDVHGFEVQNDAELGSGLAVTGNFPGAARNIDELRQDILKAKSLIPGNHRLNLHEIYGDFKGKRVDRDEVTVEHFQSWIEWAKDNDTLLDFNSSSFGHPKSGNLTLANPDQELRAFWVEHTKRCRDIANAMGEAQGDPCIMNLWVHDGCKDVSVNHALYRNLLKESLDEIFAKRQPMMKDCIEGKVFGMGLESFTVGSHDFYTAYAAKNGQLLTIDTGHYHPTESPADKVSAVLPFISELMLHVSRPVRWDSDHVTIMDNTTEELFAEIVRAKALDRVHYGLDFFDGSINRIGAYVIGSRAAQKCMLRALLEPQETIAQYELNGEGYKVLALMEEMKSMPWQAVYDEFCLRNDVPVGSEFMLDIDKYVAEVTSKR
ncbi:MAG: L-rhamnose isomerase [Bacteroidales bacterium]|nr:L-rhamnose isomerase [Candidatus Liminaster caballi]